MSLDLVFVHNRLALCAICFPSLFAQVVVSLSLQHFHLLEEPILSNTLL
jgi:hypothetical protein